jgi:O-antigen/teichoic acid export membrane protein
VATLFLSSARSTKPYDCLSYFPHASCSPLFKAVDFVTLFKELFERFLSSSLSHPREKKRLINVFSTASATAFAKAISFLLALISVPIALEYLRKERYGLLVTLTSLTALLAFADLGVGNSLINCISEADGKDDPLLKKKHVSTAFFTLLGIIALFTCGLLLFTQEVPWGHLFGIRSPEALREVNPAVWIVFACFLLNLLFGIAYKAQLGLQLGYIGSLWQAAGSILGFGGLLFCTKTDQGLLGLLAAVLGGPVLASFFNFVWFFYGSHRWLAPSISYCSKNILSAMGRLALLFFILQIAVSMGYESENLIIAWLLGPETVVQYDVHKRLFSLLPMVLGFTLTPLWPAYREALTRGHLPWVRNVFLASVLIAFVSSSFFALLLYFQAPAVLRWWIGPDFSASAPLISCLSIWLVVASLGGCLAMLLNAAGLIRFQIYSSLLMGTSNLALTIHLVPLFGPSGAVYASLISTLLFTFLPSAWMARKILTPS